MPQKDRKICVKELRDMVAMGMEEVRSKEAYKAWLKTCAHNLMNGLSLENLFRITFQSPGASTVMGYEQWKDYGRQVKPGAKGINILVPTFFEERTSGNLCKEIIAHLTMQLQMRTNAEYQLEDFNLHFTMNRESKDIIIRMPKGKEVACKDKHELYMFIQKNIVHKLPKQYCPQKVFDVSDVSIPTFLTMKHGFIDAEVVRGKGEHTAITNEEGKVVAKAKWSKDPDAPKGYEWVDINKIGKGTWELVYAPNGVAIETNPNRRSGKAEYLIFNTEERKAKFQSINHIAISEALSESVKSFVREMVHADLDGKIEQETGETLAESVIYMVCECFGIDLEEISLQNYGTWIADASPKELSKYFDIMNKEAKRIVDEITVKLEQNGLSRYLQELPKTALSTNSVRVLVERYAGQVVKKRDLLESVHDEIAIHAEQAKENADKADIVMIQKDNVRKRQSEIEKQIVLIEKLETAINKKKQDEIICQLERSFKRESCLAMCYDELNESLKRIAVRNKEGLREQFMQNAQATLTRMSKEYPKLKDITGEQKQYIAKSPYIREVLVPLLNSEPQKFVNEVTKRANAATNIASKEGIFVEVISCKATTNPPIVHTGDLAHPKVADNMIAEVEKQIRNLKAKNDFFPSTDIKIAIYSFARNHTISCYVAAIRAGDGTQDSLSDYLHKASAEKKELIHAFDQAIHEKLL